MKCFGGSTPMYAVRRGHDSVNFPIILIQFPQSLLLIIGGTSLDSG